MDSKFLLFPAITTILFFTGCGSGGGSSNNNTPGSVTSVTSSATSVSSLSSAISSIESSSTLSSSSSSFNGVTVTYEAENNFFSGGVTKASSYLQNFSSTGARVIFTVNANASATYTTNLRYANGTDSTKTLNIYVNGIFAVTTNLASTGGSTTWTTKSEQLALRTGLNTISYQYDATNSGNVNLDAISIEGGAELAARGATLTYQEYEAEAGSTNGQVSAADRTYLTVEAESSGRKFVNLNTTGQYVEWVAQQDANSLVVRYNIPDSTTGGGTNATLSLYVNGSKVKTLDLSSHYAWVYGDYPYNDNPTNAKAHHFFDESHFSGLTIPAGSTVRLQKDSGDTAAYYKIDLVDLEKIDNAYTMPDNFVSITNYGAIADDNIDDTQAINDAIAFAKANNKSVWIPAGKFINNNHISVSNIQIRGAGIWYTSLQGTNGKGGFLGAGSKVTIADLSISSDSVVRNDAADNPAFEGNFGSGSLIQNVWVEHMKVGFWLGVNNDGLFIVDGRIRDTWADGLNFAGGVKNSTISQFNIRNTGDDGLAMWSDPTWSNGVANSNNTFSFNTVQLPMLANAFAIYGGDGNKILDNIGSDTVVSSAGIAISSRFSPTSFTGTTEARRNTLNRTGGFDPGWNTTFGGLWIYAEGKDLNSPVIVDDLTINSSTYDGILLSYNQKIANLTLNNIQINGAGAFGINVSNVTGAGTFSNISIADTAQSALNNSSPFVITKGDGNVGW